MAIGTLRTNETRAWLERGRFLARKNKPDPLSAGKEYVDDAGFRDGDRVRVTGDDGTIGDVEVIWMTAIAPGPAIRRAAAAKKAPRKRIGR